MSKRHKAPGTTAVVVVAAVAAALMIAQQIAAKAARDGFFLTEFDVSALPVAMLGAALVSFVAALVLGKFIASFSPARAVPVLFGLNGVLFFLESRLVDDMPRVAAAALYLHTAAFGGAVISGFWSVVNERFDPYTARRVMSRIAVGSTVGGILGGVVTWSLAELGIAVLLLCFAGCSIAVALAVGFVGCEDQTRTDGGRTRAGLFSGVETLRDSSYLRRVAAVVALGALATGLVDYVFKAGVVSNRSGASLTAFFAAFYTATGVATFLLQAGVTGRVLKRLGVVATASTFPVAIVGFSGLALGVPGLLTLVLLRGGAMIAENSLYRAGYELFYTPVRKDQKRSAKMLIDLGFDRVGTAAASGIALAAVALGGNTGTLLLALAIATSLVALVVMRAVRQDYIASLVDRLRAAVSPGDAPVEASRAMAATFVGDIDLLDLGDEGASASASASTADASRRDYTAVLAEVHRVADQKRAAGAPKRLVPGRRASPAAAELLETPLRERLRRTASSDPGWIELREFAPTGIGQIGDVLLSRRESIDVRVRAAELLASVPSKRASEALLAVLGDANPRLRRASALALLQLCSASPALRPPRSVLVDLAARELRLPAPPLAPATAFERTSPFLTDARGNELATSVELVFLLLAVYSGVDELRLALRAITSEDAVQRGTGLEYLDNQLPLNLRRQLVSLAESPELTQKRRRVDPEVIARLADQMRAGQMGLAELRRRYREALRAEYDRRPTAPAG